MQTKISIIGLPARDKVIAGATYVANAVRATLGPFGLNALLEKGNQPTNDGYTISAEISGTLKDEFERRGALALHEACAKTNHEVGDGTTSSVVLATAIINEVVKLLPSENRISAKMKPSELLKTLEISKNNVIEKLQNLITPIETQEQLIASAKVSVEDEELANMLGMTQFMIGKDGIILVEESIGSKNSIEVAKGIRLDNGFSATHLINNQKDQSLELLIPTSVLLTNYTIDAPDLIAMKDKVFTPLIQRKRNMIILIARAFTPAAIKFCTDQAQSNLGLFPINAPYTNQNEIMKDLAAVLNATYFDTEERPLTDLTFEDIGVAKSFVARRWDATVTGEDNESTQSRISERIKALEEKLTGSLSDFERKQTEIRISQFKGGFGILKVGAETEFERKFKRDKAEDAVNSVRNAYKGGTVPGAGLAFKQISETLEEGDILKKPLTAIYDQIMLSAPEDFVIEDWVRDPYITLVSALKNACSVAGQLATINAVITTEDKKKKSDDEETE